jgi:RNA-binding protein
MVLSAKQRQFLKGLAHPLAPVVRIGKGSISPAVVKETSQSLLAHEIIKVRIEAEGADARRELAEHLAKETGSDVAAMIGKTAILYRQREEKPKIKLPK